MSSKIEKDLLDKPLNASGQSEYAQAFGVKGKYVKSPHPESSWMLRNNSVILSPPPEKAQQCRTVKNWPWRERAKNSDIFSPPPELAKKSQKQWPWQDQANKSKIFGDSKDGADSTNKPTKIPRKKWAWQERATTSNIFKAFEGKASNPKKYPWDQSKSTHEHKVDQNAKMNVVTQYMEDFSNKSGSQENYSRRYSSSTSARTLMRRKEAETKKHVERMMNSVKMNISDPIEVLKKKRAERDEIEKRARELASTKVNAKIKPSLNQSLNKSSVSQGKSNVSKTKGTLSTTTVVGNNDSKTQVVDSLFSKDRDTIQEVAKTNNNEQLKDENANFSDKIDH